MDTQDHDSAAGQGAPSNPGRRRFASVGAKASGVILTVASPAGMACVCTGPSALGSSNLSRRGTQQVTCAGLSPGYWKNHTTKWPPGCYATSTKTRQATKFASIFPSGKTSLYQTGTLLQVLQNNDPGQDPYNLGMHLVAAYLNVQSLKISFLTVDKLKLMWHDLYTYGYYAPVANVHWLAEDVKRYLESTEN